MQVLPTGLRALASVPQFIVYILTPSTKRPGKIDKLPVDHRTGRYPVGIDDPQILTDFETAQQKAAVFGEPYGVGFVLTGQDPFWFLDIDNCLNEDGSWSPLATSLVSIFSGAAVEISSSKKGLHIIGTGTAPRHARINTVFDGNRNINIEFYTEKRFVALTGINVVGDASFNATHLLPWLVENYFCPKKLVEDAKWTTAPCDQWNGPSDDAELINRALRSHKSAQAVFGGGASFADLWDANATVLATAYPPDGAGKSLYNESKADAALAQHLAFWTGNDCERMLRLMRQSKLVREKWERHRYMELTILTACAFQADRGEWLCDKPPQALDAVPVAGAASLRPVLKTGATYLTIDQQLELFDGCVYVGESHGVLIPGGYIYGPEQFRTMYGGYSFPLDTANEKTTRNAWEALRESQAFTTRRVHSTCFRPDLAYGTIVETDGTSQVNQWWPITIPRVKGDPSLFLTHLAKLFPDERDRAIVLSYIAALVQYKGIKFRWCLLIQGVEGNGKSLLSECVSFAIGKRYSHFPKPAEIAAKFNSWMFGNIFIGVDDLKVPSDQMVEVIEALKPMITREYMEIEPKGKDKTSKGVCCNFIINTNHKDGLRKTTNDRRFAPFFTPQQEKAHLTRDGLTSDYFSTLTNWLINENGYAIVAEYLHTYEIPDEFNPATKCQYAPETTSTQDAIAQGLGGVEQEIVEAIEQEKPGFRGGWVSSIWLEALLRELQLNRRIAPNRRRDILQTLGYDWHPGLTGGRVNNTVLPDNGKPKLFIKQGHKDRDITNGAAIAKSYEMAQQVSN